MLERLHDMIYDRKYELPKDTSMVFPYICLTVFIIITILWIITS